MIKWGLDRGIEWNKKLDVFDFKETGRGVITNQDIEENEILISIPEKFLIHSRSKFSITILNPTNQSSSLKNNNDNDDEFYKPFYNCLNQFNSKQRISFHLIIEKLIKNHSIWFDYLNDLPNEYSISSTYSDEEINSLKYKIYVETVYKLKNEMINSFNSFKEILLNNYENDLNRIVIKLKDGDNDDDDIILNDIINMDLYKWCWGTIQSRTYYYDRNMKQNKHTPSSSSTTTVDKDDCTLVPLADLFNHSSDINTETYFNESKQCYQVITKSKFKKDNQVFISYGKHSNFTLINYYGFIIENNDQHSIPINQSDAIPPNISDSDSNDPLYQKKLLILEQYGLSIFAGNDLKFLVSMDSELPFSWNYLSTLKVLFMDKFELDNQLELNLFHYDLPISKNNNEKLLNFLLNLTNLQLNFFKNALINDDDDDDIIKRFEISYILKNNIKIWENCYSWLIIQQNLNIDDITQPINNNKVVVSTTSTTTTNNNNKKIKKIKKIKK